MKDEKTISFESDLADLKSAIKGLAVECSAHADGSYLGGYTRRLLELSSRLEFATTNRLNMDGLQDITTELKELIYTFSKADIVSPNLGLLEERVHMFQETKHREEIHRRTTA